MSRRIVLDLTKCEECESCDVQCGYFYRPHDADHGIQTLKERATLMVVCRRCEHASCVTACPCEALERQPDGVIKRFNLRCVSCKLCTQACPFGTIYPEMVGFYVTPCDYCTQRTDEQPPCLTGCQRDAISYREVDSRQQNTHIIDDHFAVVAPGWDKENV